MKTTKKTVVETMQINSSPAAAKFSAAMTRWVSAAMARQDIRYYLNGVHVRPSKRGGVDIVATDGHRLMMAHDAEGFANREITFSMTTAAISACSKIADTIKQGQGRHIVIDGTRLIVQDVNGDEVFVMPGKCEIECKYVDFDKVVPAGIRKNLEPAGDGAVQIHLLAEMAKHLPRAFRSMSQPVRLWRKKPEGKEQGAHFAVLVEFVQLPLVGVIMPMRIDRADLQNWHFVEGSK